MYLNAALFACDASIESVAQAFDLDTPEYLRLAAKTGINDLTKNPDAEPPLAAALGGVLDDVLHLARLDPEMWAA